MTARETSLMTGVTQGTIYKKLNQGTLPGYWDGSRWTINKADALTWAEYEADRGRVLMFSMPAILSRLDEF